MQFDNNSLKQSFDLLISNIKTLEISMRLIISEINNLKQTMTQPEALTLNNTWGKLQKEIEKASEKIIEQKEKIIEIYKIYENSTIKNDSSIVKITEKSLETLSKVDLEISNL